MDGSCATWPMPPTRTRRCCRWSASSRMPRRPWNWPEDPRTAPGLPAVAGCLRGPGELPDPRARCRGSLRRCPAAGTHARAARPRNCVPGCCAPSGPIRPPGSRRWPPCPARRATGRCAWRYRRALLDLAHRDLGAADALEAMPVVGRELADLAAAAIEAALAISRAEAAGALRRRGHRRPCAWR